MNCGKFQESLYEYLDSTLPPAEKAQAEAHLGACGACRELVQNEFRLAQVLSTRLEKAVESVALDADARSRIAKAVLQASGEEGAKPNRWLLSLLLGRSGAGRRGASHAVIQRPWRLAFPVFAAALVVIGGIWISHRLFPERVPNRQMPASLAASDGATSVHVACSVPAYTFQAEGDLVIDALTRETVSMDVPLVAER